MSDVLRSKRIIPITDTIEMETGASVVESLLEFEAEDPSLDVYLFINSSGGSVAAGLAIYDVMQLVRCDVATVGLGKAESIAAVLLAAGAPGKRLAMPQLQVLVHQPTENDVSGSTADLVIEADHMEEVRQRVFAILAKHTGKSAEEVHGDAQRDQWFDAESARDYGLVDVVVTSRRDLP